MLLLLGEDLFPHFLGKIRGLIHGVVDFCLLQRAFKAEAHPAEQRHQMQENLQVQALTDPYPVKFTKEISRTSI